VVQSEPATPTSQPRPHKITIYLAFLVLMQPVVTGIGVFFAWRTLKENTDNFVLGNRAYLAFRSIKERATDEQLIFAITIANAGNTPATSVTVYYMVFVPGQPPSRIGPKMLEAPFMAAKETSEQTFTYPRQEVEGATDFAFLYLYKDVFNELNYGSTCRTYFNQTFSACDAATTQSHAEYIAKFVQP
jgi:hypothetical protein